MGVMPLPHYSTLHLHIGTNRVKLSTDSPSVGEFGRLHFTKQEIKQLQKEKGKNNMAFQIVDISTLPVREFGRKSTEPRVSFTEAGRFSFNKLIQNSWEGVEKLLVQWDSEARLLAFKGFKAGEGVKTKQGPLPENKYLKVVLGKKDNSLSASGAGILGQIGYDFAKAGNQSFEAKFDDKNKLYIVTVPAETPTARPKQIRKKKDKVAAVATANGANGAAISAPLAPPAEDELLMEV